MPKKLKLKDYQKYAVRRVLKAPAVGLFLDMGLGKTVISLTALRELMFNYCTVRRCLIIAPLRVAHDTWSREMDKWEGFGYFTVSKVLGDAKRRRRALARKDADLFIINRENVVWLVDQFGPGAWPFDMIIIDELSSFKNQDSKRFKALRTVRPHVRRFVGLTGTPAPNGLLDLWPQLYLLDLGKRLGPTITAYRQRYFSAGASDGHVVFDWRLNKGAAERIYNRVRDICVSMKARDYLPELPPATPVTIEVDMTKSERAKYKQLKKELVLQLEDGVIVASNAGVLAGKLLQLANGCIYDTPDDGGPATPLRFHDRKLEALDEIIEAARAQGDSVLVFYAFKHDAARILDRYKFAEKLTDSECIKRWNAGEIPVLITHPASAGHGLNLQDGGHVVVWFGLTYNLELYDQGNARLNRQGQTQPVFIYHITTKNTIDQDALASLEGKSVTQNSLMRAVRAELVR